jgi:hypothetical protein
LSDDTISCPNCGFRPNLIEFAQKSLELAFIAAAKVGAACQEALNAHRSNDTARAESALFGDWRARECCFVLHVTFNDISAIANYTNFKKYKGSQAEEIRLIYNKIKRLYEF